MDAGTADTKAQDWCARIARETAIPAAHAAADAASTWITIDAYGSGAAPIIDGSSNTIKYGLQFPPGSFTGGWKIKNIKVQNFKRLGIQAEVGAATLASGLWLENVVINNIAGDVESGAFPPPYAPDSNTFCPTGLMVFRTANVVMKTCSFTNSGDNVIIDDGCDDCLWDTVTVSGGGYGGASYSAASNTTNNPIGGTGKFKMNTRALFTGCTFSGNGVIGKADGTVALFIFAVIDGSLVNCEITGTIGPSSPDRVALNTPLGITDLTIRNCNIHDNMGSAFLADLITVPGNTTGRSGVVIDNTIFNNNATTAPGTGQPALVRWADNGDHDWIWTRNTITRAVAVSQKLFGDRLNTPSALTDTPPTGWVFPLGAGVSTNVVTN